MILYLWLFVSDHPYFRFQKLAMSKRYMKLNCAALLRGISVLVGLSVIYSFNR